MNKQQQAEFISQQDYEMMSNKSTDELMDLIGSMSMMIFAAVGIATVIILLTYKKLFKSRQSQERELKQSQQLISTSKIRMNRQQQKQQYHQYQQNKKSFSFIDYQDQQQQQISQAYRNQTRQQLINILHQQQDYHISHQQPYSLHQLKVNFFNKLQKDKCDYNGVYYDQQDIRQRETRKRQAERQKNQLLQKELQKQLVNPIVANNKPKQTQKTQNLLQEKLPQSQPIQPTNKPYGQKILFADKPKQPTTLPSQGGLNFGQVSLGLASEKKVTEKKAQQTKSLFGNIEKPKDNKDTKEAIEGGKKEEKPSLFSTSNVSSLFGQQSAGQIGTDKIPNLFGSPTTIQSQQTNLFGQKQAPIQKPQTQKKEQIPVPKPQPQALPQQPSQPQPIAPKPSTVSQPSSSAPQKIQKKDYLQMLIDYSKGAKEHCELKKTKINNFGRSISNLKQIYDTSIDFIHTINVGDSKEIQTLACVIYDFLIHKTIPTWPKQEGWEMFPPRGKNETKWKISITTYVIKLNLYRAMGHENLWLIVFGKLLSLLDFTWKRTSPIPQSDQAYNDLDLVKNGYFSLQNQEDMAPKYFTRLDLVTYFLFCMTTFDPELIAEYLCQTAGQDKQTLQEIKKLKYKWNYNYFWILVETILTNKTKTYFKPILYMNILASIYLQIRKNKVNSGDFKDFDHLRKFLVKEGIECTNESELERNQQIQTLAEIDERNRNFTFDGEDFLGQIETLNFYFIEKDGEYRKANADRKGFEEFQKRCSVFDFFKSQSRLG